MSGPLELNLANPRTAIALNAFGNLDQVQNILLRERMVREDGDDERARTGDAETER